jgi:CBS domain-containing protein
MAIFVRDIMDPDPPTVGPHTDVETVVHIMREHESEGIAVVNDGGRCIGIITEADLVLSGEGGDLHLPHFIELFGGIVFLEPLQRFEDRLRKAVASKARDLMSEDPDTVAPDATIAEAARTISRTGHNRLPVVEHGRLVGIVTRIDVLDALTREA